MEDKRLGRRTKTGATPKTLGNGVSTPIVGGSEKRVHISFGTTGAACRIAPDGGNDIGGASYALSGTLPPLDFDIEIHGDIVTKPWSGSGVAGAVDIIVLESFLGDV